ncbi:MAG: hypothetical protein HY044_04850 [Candidatus Woesebacteria bacterium]|nr:MAG: hypothetical protein HY044_04850 [Candidatus Woesebacteria bacterium]
MVKWFLATVFFLISVLVSLFVVNQVNRKYDIRSSAAPSTSLSFLLVNNKIKVNDQFSLRVYISTGLNQTAGAQLNINYDPLKLRLNGVVAGTFYTNPTILGPTIDNTSGKLSYALIVPPGSMPVSGSGVLATLNFTAISQGITPVSFDSANTLVIATGEGGQNVISTLSPISINVRKASGK